MLADMLPVVVPIVVAAGVAVGIPVFVVVVRRMMARVWAPLVAAYPPRMIGADGVRKVGQSFGYGSFQASGAMVLTTDDRCLHVEGWGPFRWLGQTRISIPWEAITVSETKLGRAVAIEGHPVMLPPWCVDLAVQKSARSTG